MTELLVGDDIAGYHLLELAGEGGMGRVYRARQNRLDRIVALKVIRPEIAADRSFRERFQREARMAASIDHPCVVPVYEADEVNGVLFVAMRWVAGPNLRQMLLAEAPLEPVRVAHIVNQAAAALEAAHAAGLIHRDVKPANILLEGSRVYLSDFGVARAISGPDDATLMGGFLGTVDYAAPELLRGGAIDSRVDVYALGCVLHEMLTGAVAYPADSLADKVTAHLTGDPPRPSAIRSELPREFDQVVNRALQKNPGSRYGTAGELGAAVERALHGPRPRFRAAARLRVRARRILMAVSAALVAALAAGAVLAWPGGSAPRRSHDPITQAANSAPGVDPVVARLVKGAGLTGTQTTRLAGQCANVLAGPPRTCHSRWGGLETIGNRGSVLHMRTMTLKLTGVSTVSKFHDAQAGITAVPPSGTRFVVIDLTVTNLTKKFQVFEANETTRRLTALVLTNARGDVDPIAGPDGQVYSSEWEAGEVVVANTMLGAWLPADGRSVSGKLVFHYPVSDLGDLSRAILIVRDLGETWGTSGSFAAIRLGK